MHQGGLLNFNSEEALLHIGELYVSRRRDGDRIEMLEKQLSEAHVTNAQQNDTIEIQKEMISSLERKVSRKGRK